MVIPPARRCATALACSTITALVLAGCGSGASNEAASSDQTITATVDPALAKQVPADLAASKTLEVGVALGPPPDEFVNDQKKIVGWEVDLARAAAQTLGLTADIQEAGFDSLIPALQAKRFDAATGRLGVSAERERAVDFVTTLEVNELFAALKDSDLKVNTLDDLCGHHVATARGTREVEFGAAQSSKCVSEGKPPVDMQVYNDGNQAALSLTSKRSELYWLGSTAIDYFVQNSGGTTKIVGSYLKPTPMGIALPKNSGLAEPLRAAIQQLIDNGTYTKILKKWGLQVGAIKESEINPKVSDG